MHGRGSHLQLLSEGLQIKASSLERKWQIEDMSDLHDRAREWGRRERCIVLLKLRQFGVKEEGVCTEQNTMSGEIRL